MGLSTFLSKLEITLKIWAKHAILMGYGCFTRSWNHHLRCVHLIVPSLVHLIVPTTHRKKILYWSNLVGQLTRNYKSTQAEVSFWTLGLNHNEKFGFLILLKHLIVPVGAFNSPMYKRDWKMKWVLDTDQRWAETWSWMPILHILYMFHQVKFWNCPCKNLEQKNRGFFQKLDVL